MFIRQEQPTDYDEVYELVKASFRTAPHGDGTEADYLNDVRKRNTFIPELSLVAVADGKIVGQIVLYKTEIVTDHDELTELVLSPMCVHPEYFRRGIASKMIDTAISKAKDMGFRAVFLCGTPDFYTKFGFAPTYEFGIFHVKDESRTAKWSMALELFKGSLNGITGTIATN